MYSTLPPSPPPPHTLLLSFSFPLIFTTVRRTSHLRPLSFSIVYYVLQQPYSRRDTSRPDLFPALLLICVLFTTARKSNRLVYRFDRTFGVEFKKRNPATPLVFRHPSYLCAFYDGTQTASSDLLSRLILARRETS